MKHEHSLAVRDLDKHPFIPERDDEIVRRFADELRQVPDYRCIVYTRSIDHEERHRRAPHRGWASGDRAS